MREEWRRFILQWILPAGVFIILILFVFASFSASIKRDTSITYEDTITAVTKEYGTVMKNAIRSTTSVGMSMAMIIEKSNSARHVVDAALEALSANTDAYLSVITTPNGKGIASNGETVDLNESSYASHLSSDLSLERFYVEDDGVIGNSAYVISVKINGSVYNRLLIYYPMAGANTRKYVPVETEHDPMGYAMLIDVNGNVVSSTGSNESLVVGKNLWTDVITNVNVSTITRNKTKVRSGTAGYLEATINNRDYVVHYAPVGNSDFFVVVNFTKSGIDKQEARLYHDSIRRIGWCVAIVVLFILVITGINITRIFASERNSKELSEKADTDQLTGMKNKIATEREIKEYMEKYPGTLSMLFLIDIDNFKKINDTMGHAFGDEVLRELGKNIGVNFRVSDIIGRTGGDEFTIFLKNLKEDANCIREAQKLVYFFKHFQVGDYVKYSVTASIGAAVYPEHGSDFESLYKAADSAVYKSKKRGKNQLSFVDDRDKTPEEIAEADAHQISLDRHLPQV
ncbi:MAG: diguanylate cyclase [Lachnospiraceae bacterium]|nr:diguanylate cyclase [Lachnospiraceae bacterium]